MQISVLVESDECAGVSESEGMGHPTEMQAEVGLPEKGRMQIQGVARTDKAHPRERPFNAGCISAGDATRISHEIQRPLLFAHGAA